MDPYLVGGPYFEVMYLFAAVITALILNGVTCAVIARQKNRSGLGWFLLGVLFAPWAIVWAFAVKARPEDADELDRVRRVRQDEERRRPGIPPGLYEELPPVEDDDTGELGPKTRR